MNSSHNYYRYYITSAGRIWGVGNEERLDGEAQMRRELMGNDFATPEEAAFAKAQLEAKVRTEKYAEKVLRLDADNNPVIEVRYHFPNNDREPLLNDLRMLVGNGAFGGATCQ